MKLLCCSTCNQIFNISFDYQECRGGHGGAQYVDDNNTKVWGPREKIFVLGFQNSSFISALREQLNQGDQKPDFLYCGKLVSKGRTFESFVIPESAPSIIRSIEKF